MKTGAQNSWRGTAPLLRTNFTYSLRVVNAYANWRMSALVWRSWWRNVRRAVTLSDVGGLMVGEALCRVLVVTSRPAAERIMSTVSVPRSADWPLLPVSPSPHPPLPHLFQRRPAAAAADTVVAETVMPSSLSSSWRWRRTADSNTMLRYVAASKCVRFSGVSSSFVRYVAPSPFAVTSHGTAVSRHDK